MVRKVFQLKGAGYFVAVSGILAVTATLLPIRQHINSTTVALTLLLVVLFTATLSGSRPALLASFIGVLSLNFFFLPPYHTFAIDDPENWVALAVFLVTAFTVGQLSARAKQRAEEAETGRVHIERLYTELRDAFERASHAEALKQSEKLKSALLDAVTHDLRTPLTSIKASATTLLSDVKAVNRDEGLVGLETEERKELLEVIDEEADRLNHFIEGLMELARIDAGQLQLRKQWASIDEIVDATLKRAKPLTHDHKMEVLLDSELPSVRVDERALAEVIYSLVDNAAKYSALGSRILLEAKSGQDATIVISIEDEGVGIPADLRERVFEKFFRALRNGDAAKHSAGSGMGLAIARGIVEAHGGRIWIEAGRNGTGTKVVVNLPTGD
ncbi:MAG: sensor histidine kinase [Pyrinomonadaceae bacterium]